MFYEQGIREDIKLNLKIALVTFVFCAISILLFLVRFFLPWALVGICSGLFTVIFGLVVYSQHCTLEDWVIPTVRRKIALFRRMGHLDIQEARRLLEEELRSGNQNPDARVYSLLRAAAIALFDGMGLPKVQASLGGDFAIKLDYNEKDIIFVGPWQNPKHNPKACLVLSYLLGDGSTRYTKELVLWDQSERR